MHPHPQSSSGAEAFARMLDGVAEVRSWDEPGLDDLAELVAAVRKVERTDAPAPRAAFTAGLRAELMAADITPVREPEPPASEAAAAVIDLAARRKRKATRRAYTAAAIGSMVLSTAGVAAAAQHALPGSPLYGVKRAIESVELSFATSDTARGRDLLDQAHTRLVEVNDLSAESGNADLIEQTLRLFSSSASEGTNLLFMNFQQQGNASSLDAIRSFAADAAEQLNAIPERAIAESRAQMLEAASLVANVEQQSKLLCPTCAALPPLTAKYQRLSSPTSPASFAPLLSAPSIVVKQPAKPPVSNTPEPTPPTEPPTTPPTPPTPPTTPTEPSSPEQAVTGLGKTLNGVTKPVTETVGSVLQVTTGLVGGVTDVVGGLLGGAK